MSPSLPILPVPGIPGGTLVSPVPRPGTRAFGSPPNLVSTSNIPRATVLALAANASRGTGFNGTRAPQALVHASARTPGLWSNHSLVRALAGVDIRNPAIAPFLLRTRMTAGATRVY